MTSGMFDHGVEQICLAGVNWGTTTVKAILLKDTGAGGVQPGQDTWATEADADDYELSTAGGYTVGGQAIDASAPSVSHGSPSYVKCGCSANEEWASPFTATDIRWTVTWYGADNTGPVLTFHDFGADKDGGGGAFTVVWDSNGVFRITVTDAT